MRLNRGWAYRSALAGLAALFFWAAPARAAEPAFMTFGAGAFDVNGDDTATLLNFQYTDTRKWVWHLRPITGAFVTHEGSLYGYAGLTMDIYFGPRLVLSPSFAPGLYLKNGGKELGHVVEFRSALAAAWRFDDRSRLGVDFSHISNAGLDENNPGANQLMLFYSVPFSRGK